MRGTLRPCPSPFACATNGRYPEALVRIFGIQPFGNEFQTLWEQMYGWVHHHHNILAGLGPLSNESNRTPVTMAAV
jgi:hypothetical protein